MKIQDLSAKMTFEDYKVYYFELIRDGQLNRLWSLGIVPTEIEKESK